MEQDSAWRPAVLSTGFRLYVRGPRAPQVRTLEAGGYVVGDLFERDSPTPAANHLALRGEPPAQAHELLARHHGRYVALWPHDGQISALRDPTGSLEAVRWRRSQMMLLSGELSAPLPDSLKPVAQINWPRVAARLVRPALVSDGLALDGVTALGPGELALGEAPPVPLWAPQAFVQAAPASSAELVRRVHHSVAGLAGRSGGFVCELSGGFDSSVVATSLPRRRLSSGRWVHFVSANPEGDEREYAAAVAGLLRRRLQMVELDGGAAFNRDQLVELSQGWRPSLNGLDFGLDEALVEACQTAQAELILTGQGGDALFFQARTPWVACDLRGRGFSRGERRERRLAIARANATSIWRILALEAAAQLGGGPHLQAPAGAWASARTRAWARRAQGHAWLQDLAAIAPAKRLQLQALVYAQRYLGPSRRSAVADVAHPLLAQPIVEACLSLPIYDLTEGARGRAMARRAFAGQLPSAVADRQTKGDLTAHYGRILARSLPVVRPFLLEGALAGQGLLELDRLAEHLTDDQLIVRGGYGDLLQLMALEAWVRRWS